MRVAAYQAPYRDYPAADGAELVAARLLGLRDRGVDVLCCPEALIGELANESDGDSPASVSLCVSKGELADALAPLFGSGMTIVVGFTERAGDGSPYNAAAVVADDRIAGVYRKLYPGRSACRPGVELPVFWHGQVPFGVLICNDASYVEPARVLAARGAALLVVPVHGGHRPHKELALRERGTSVLIARAVDNGIPLIAADVAGFQGARVSRGTTTIIDSRGTIVAAAPEFEEGVIVADLELDAPARVASTENFLSSNPAATRHS